VEIWKALVLESVLFYVNTEIIVLLQIRGYATHNLQIIYVSGVVDQGD
jgi:hypothetical protein